MATIKGRMVIDQNGLAELKEIVGQFADSKAQEIIDVALPPVDTGFLRASGYINSVRNNTFDRTWESGQYMSTKGRGVQKRERVEVPQYTNSPDGVVAGWAAIYAWFVEDKQPFMYTALLQVAEGEVI